MRYSLRHELFSLLTVASVPVAVFCIFPRDAVGFSARRDAVRAEPFAAFVTIPDGSYSDLMRRARSTWQLDESVVVAERAALGDLPPDDAEFVVDMPVKVPVRIPETLRFVPGGFEPSCRAARPLPLAPPSEAERRRPLPFSREELLKID